MGCSCTKQEEDIQPNRKLNRLLDHADGLNNNIVSPNIQTIRLNRNKEVRIETKTQINATNINLRRNETAHQPQVEVVPLHGDIFLQSKIVPNFNYPQIGKIYINLDIYIGKGLKKNKAYKCNHSKEILDKKRQEFWSNLYI
jgi:hypothetical protein